MPVKIACPKCSKKYTLPDSAVGKAVKCKACETTFRTKMPAGGGPTSPQAANPTARTAKPAQQRPTQQRPAQPARPNPNEFGLEGGFQQQADIFGSPQQAAAGLDNFAEQEDAVAPIVVGPAGSAAPKENPFQSVLTNSSMRGSSARNKARKKKLGKAGPDVSAYGIVRMGMMAVFGSGAAMMLATFVFLILMVMGLLSNSALEANGGPGALDAIVGILSLIVFGVFGLSSLVMMVGQVMCMFAPNGNERFNSIGAAVLAFLSMVGSIIVTLVFGMAVTAAVRSGRPPAESAGGLVTLGIGYLAGILICGVMIIAAMFMFVNFYRRIGQNIKSDGLVKVSNQATIAVCVSMAMPILGFGLAFILGMSGMDQQAASAMLGIFYLLSLLFNLVVLAVILRMVWSGISNLSTS